MTDLSPLEAARANVRARRAARVAAPAHKREAWEAQHRDYVAQVDSLLERGPRPLVAVDADADAAGDYHR